MPTSAEDLQQEAERVQQLRKEVAQAEASNTARERELANDITMTQLQAEAAQLEARLAVAKKQGESGAAEQGASAPLDAVKAQLERSVQQQKAAEADPADSARATESTDAGGASGDTASATSTGATGDASGGTASAAASGPFGTTTTTKES